MDMNSIRETIEDFIRQATEDAEYSEHHGGNKAKTASFKGMAYGLRLALGAVGESEVTTPAAGLSRRDEFASRALQGLISNPCFTGKLNNGADIDAEEFAVGAVTLADALIAELDADPTTDADSSAAEES